MLEAMKCRSESSCLESCDRLLSSASPNQVIFVSNFVLSHLRHLLPPQRLKELRARLIGYKVPALLMMSLSFPLFTVVHQLQKEDAMDRSKWKKLIKYTHTQPFYGPFSGTTQVSLVVVAVLVLVVFVVICIHEPYVINH